MAIDFSTLLDTEEPKTARDPYARLKESLRGKRLHTKTVAVGLDTRTTVHGDVVVKASVPGRHDPGQTETIDLIFADQLAEDFRACVDEPLMRRRCALIDAATTNADWDDADGVTLDLTVEGAFRPRTWTGRDGTRHTAWEMHVARFTLRDDAGEIVVRGDLPE